MPHQCTACGRTFPDGSKEMLSGCPDCGGNKFQFKPGGVANEEPVTPGSETVETRSDGAAGDSPTENIDETGGTETTASSDAVTSDGVASDAGGIPRSTDSMPSESDRSARTETGDGDSTHTDSERLAETDAEDTAQASARSDVVSPDELNRASREVSSSTPTEADDSSTHRPDIDDLRDELNAQFESIRIVSPGKYELNLMELYDRQEYIISLQEDGRYVIEMPDAWGIGDE